MRHAFRKRIFSEASVECAMCIGGKEDCSQLIFEYPFAHAIWACHRTSWWVLHQQRPSRDLSRWMIQDGGGARENLHCAMGTMTVP